jgi:hypothetical protein
MAIWPNWRGRARERAARKVEDRRRAEQEAAQRHVADLAAAEARRQREQRDRRFPPEHRPDQVER